MSPYKKALMDAAGNPHELVASRILGNKHIMVNHDVQNKLADSQHMSVRGTLARSRLLSSDVAKRKLVTDKTDWVREGLALNTSILSAVRLEDASDTDCEIHDKLSRDPSSRVRNNLRENPAVHKKIKQQTLDYWR